MGIGTRMFKVKSSLNTRSVAVSWDANDMEEEMVVIFMPLEAETSERRVALPKARRRAHWLSQLKRGSKIRAQKNGEWRQATVVKKLRKAVFSRGTWCNFVITFDDKATVRKDYIFPAHAMFELEPST